MSDRSPSCRFRRDLRMDLLIRRLEPTDEAAFAEASAGWDDDSGFLWTRPAEGQSFADWVEGLRREEAGIDLKPGRVPATVLAGFVDGKLVARASVRHRLNEVLATFGGNIGYAVVAPYRRRGFATRMLLASLDELRRLGVSRALVTCNVDNEGSRRTIEKCGGVFENVYVPESGPARRRYWIDIV